MWWHIFISDPFRNLLDIAIIYLLFYYLLRVLRGTRALQVLQGLLFLLGLSIAARWLNLYTINWVLDNVWPVLIVSLVIIFHPEIRRVLASLGRQPLFRSLIRDRSETVQEVVKATSTLGKRHIGALIALQRDANLQRFIDTGISVDGHVTAELLTTIFTPHSTLHDGAVIIQGERLAAAACLFPLTERQLNDQTIGTRHRAAIGLSEEVDAAIVVVSEETGGVSLALGGSLTRDLDPPALSQMLKQLFSKQ